MDRSTPPDLSTLKLGGRAWVEKENPPKLEADDRKEKADGRRIGSNGGVGVDTTE